MMIDPAQIGIPLRALSPEQKQGRARQQEKIRAAQDALCARRAAAPVPYDTLELANTPGKTAADAAASIRGHFETIFGKFRRGDEELRNTVEGTLGRAPANMTESLTGSWQRRSRQYETLLGQLDQPMHLLERYGTPELFTQVVGEIIRPMAEDDCARAFHLISPHVVVSGYPLGPDTQAHKALLTFPRPRFSTDLPAAASAFQPFPRWAGVVHGLMMSPLRSRHSLLILLDYHETLARFLTERLEQLCCKKTLPYRISMVREQLEQCQQRALEIVCYLRQSSLKLPLREHGSFSASVRPQLLPAPFVFFQPLMPGFELLRFEPDVSDVNAHLAS